MKVCYVTFKNMKLKCKKNILAFYFQVITNWSVSEIKMNVILFWRTFWCQHFTRIILLCLYQILMQIHQFRGTLQDCRQGLAAASSRIGCVINKNPHHTDIPPLIITSINQQKPHHCHVDWAKTLCSFGGWN